MAIVEITGGEGSVPVRFEVAAFTGNASNNFYADLETRGIAKQAAKAGAKTTRQIYGEAIEMACELAAQTEQRLAAMDKANQGARPDEFEVKFALSFDAALDAKVVSIGSAAEVEVRMQWNRGPGA
jgi:hypothetical protein